MTSRTSPERNYVRSSGDDQEADSVQHAKPRRRRKPRGSRRKYRLRETPETSDVATVQARATPTKTAQKSDEDPYLARAFTAERLGTWPSNARRLQLLVPELDL